MCSAVRCCRRVSVHTWPLWLLSLGSLALPSQATRAGPAPGTSDLCQAMLCFSAPPSFPRLPLAQSSLGSDCIKVWPLSGSSQFQRGLLEGKNIL